jgi:hypothetical protein
MRRIVSDMGGGESGEKGDKRRGKREGETLQEFRSLREMARGRRIQGFEDWEVSQETGQRGMERRAPGSGGRSGAGGKGSGACTRRSLPLGGQAAGRPARGGARHPTQRASAGAPSIDSRPIPLSRETKARGIIILIGNQLRSISGLKSDLQTIEK